MTNDFRTGGYIPGSVRVTLHPDECVLLHDGEGGFVCGRAHHADRHCGRIEAGRVSRLIDDLRQLDAALRQVWP